MSLDHDTTTDWSLQATILSHTGPLVVNAYPTETPGVVVNLGLIHNGDHLEHGDCWTVTHARSGYSLAGDFDRFHDALAAAARFNGIVDWESFSTVEEWRELSTPEFLQRCRDARDGVVR